MEVTRVDDKIYINLYDNVVMLDLDGMTSFSVEKELSAEGLCDPNRRPLSVIYRNGVKAGSVFFGGGYHYTLIEKLKEIMKESEGVSSEERNTVTLDDFREAVFNNDIEEVKRIMYNDDIDPSVDNNFAIRDASSNGHVEIVKLLLEDTRTDPSCANNEAIRYASDMGHVEVVKLLLTDPRVDPSVDNNGPIRRASKNGYVEIVELLLADSRVDPSDRNNKAIREALKNGRVEIVKLLLTDGRVYNFMVDKLCGR